jgi:hypothetical protein
MTSRETRALDVPIDAPSTSESVNNGAVHVRDVHHMHGCAANGLNPVEQSLTYYTLPERTACALHAEYGIQQSISHFTTFPIDPPIVTVSRNELEDSNVVRALKMKSHRNSLE